MFETLKAVKGVFGPRMDPDAVIEPDQELARVAVSVIQILKKYFRAEVSGLENIPEGKALLVCNHNAGITSMDGFFLGAEWHRKTDGKDPLYFLAHDMMVALPVVGNMLLKLGSIRASHETAAKAFGLGRKVAVFPGGNYEAFRPFSQRYQIDLGGKKGFLKLALRHNVPIVPVVSIGGHETFFVLHRGERIARLTGVRKYLRSESFPIFIGLPWGVGFGPIFHLPLPAKHKMEVGEPITLDAYSPEDADRPDKLEELYKLVEGRMQDMMDRLASERRFPVIG
jgi:1-acyl-sn-glycerol-3-phosphate acyltransferase